MRSGVFHQSFSADEAILDTGLRRGFVFALIAALALLPFVGGDYLMFIACLTAINIIAVLGLNILTGFTGLLSIGHGAFVGIGAYTVAILSERFGAPIVLAVPAAVAMSCLVGVLFGLPSLRIKGLYLAIATIAAQFITLFVFSEWTSMTGGDGGKPVAPGHMFGITLGSDRALYWLVMPVMLLAVAFSRNLFRTRIGRGFIAVRERDYSAEVIGVNLLRAKLLSFAIGAGLAGLSGALLAYFYRVVTPGQFGLAQSIFYLSAIIVGGLGRTTGSVLGAIFMTLLPEALSVIVPALPGMNDIAAATLAAPINEVVFGLLIIGFLLFEPLGLAEIWTRIRLFWERWPFAR
jgi:branched-chain amino acid transport system permease protein